MKIQEIVLLLLVLCSVLPKNPKLPAALGLLFLLASAPLFAFWIFYTAQQLVTFAILAFLLSILMHIYYARKGS